MLRGLLRMLRRLLLEALTVPCQGSNLNGSNVSVGGVFVFGTREEHRLDRGGATYNPA